MTADTPVSSTTPVTAQRLREHADNIGHSDRRIYPVGPLLDAADEMDRLRSVLQDIAAERGHCGICGRLAEGSGMGMVGCDDSPRCRWDPMDAPAYAREALTR